MERKRLESSGASALRAPDAPELGLVELIVVALPDISDTSHVAEALQQLVESSSIHILDLVVLTTQPEGTFTSLEFEEVAGLTLLKDVEGEVGGWLSTDDIALVGDALPPRTTALVLVVEDTWAAPLAQAVRTCGGRIVGGERIPVAGPSQEGRGES